MHGNTDPLRSSADDPVVVPVASSALARLHPDLAEEFAEFLVFAGWTPADLGTLTGGDPVFRAEVQAAMRRLLAVPGGEQ